MDNGTWSTEDITQNRNNWNLAADSELLKHLQAFSKKIVNDANSTLQCLNDFEEDVNEARDNFSNLNNRFLGLADVQFIENRVQDEDVSIIINEPATACRQAIGNTSLKLKEALDNGLKVLNSNYDVIQIEDSDSESEDTKDVLLKPRNLYNERKLPFVIGSDDFARNDEAGLSSSSSSESSDEDEGQDLHENMTIENELPYLKINIPSNKMPSDSDDGENSIPESDQERPFNVAPHTNKANENFVDQLRERMRNFPIKEETKNIPVSRIAFSPAPSEGSEKGDFSSVASSNSSTSTPMAQREIISDANTSSSFLPPPIMKSPPKSKWDEEDGGFNYGNDEGDEKEEEDEKVWNMFSRTPPKLARDKKEEIFSPEERRPENPTAWKNKEFPEIADTDGVDFLEVRGKKAQMGNESDKIEALFDSDSDTEDIFSSVLGSPKFPPKMREKEFFGERAADKSDETMDKAKGAEKEFSTASAAAVGNLENEIPEITAIAALNDYPCPVTAFENAKCIPADSPKIVPVDVSANVSEKDVIEDTDKFSGKSEDVPPRAGNSSRMEYKDDKSGVEDTFFSASPNISSSSESLSKIRRNLGQQPAEIKPPVKERVPYTPGKLASNRGLNINVKALLPGGRLVKQEQPVDKIAKNSTVEPVEKIHHEKLRGVTKERAKIGGKRRPPSRAARKNASLSVIEYASEENEVIKEEKPVGIQIPAAVDSTPNLAISEQVGEEIESETEWKTSKFHENDDKPAERRKFENDNAEERNASEFGQKEPISVPVEWKMNEKSKRLTLFDDSDEDGDFFTSFTSSKNNVLSVSKKNTDIFNNECKSEIITSVAIAKQGEAKPKEEKNIFSRSSSECNLEISQIKKEASPEIANKSLETAGLPVQSNSSPEEKAEMKEISKRGNPKQTCDKKKKAADAGALKNLFGEDEDDDDDDGLFAFSGKLPPLGKKAPACSIFSDNDDRDIFGNEITTKQSTDGKKNLPVGKKMPAGPGGSQGSRRKSRIVKLKGDSVDVDPLNVNK